MRRRDRRRESDGKGWVGDRDAGLPRVGIALDGDGGNGNGVYHV